jgi:hypothetical protein
MPQNATTPSAARGAPGAPSKGVTAYSLLGIIEVAPALDRRHGIGRHPQQPPPALLRSFPAAASWVWNYASVSVPADRRWRTRRAPTAARITNWRVRTPGPATYEKGLAHPACVSASEAFVVALAIRYGGGSGRWGCGNAHTPDSQTYDSLSPRFSWGYTTNLYLGQKKRSYCADFFSCQRNSLSVPKSFTQMFLRLNINLNFIVFPLYLKI